MRYCRPIRIYINPLNAELNPIRHLLALVGAHHIVHVSGIRVKKETAELAKEETSVVEERIK